jgi:hypothetical protein
MRGTGISSRFEPSKITLVLQLFPCDQPFQYIMSLLVQLVPVFWNVHVQVGPCS